MSLIRFLRLTPLLSLSFLLTLASNLNADETAFRYKLYLEGQFLNLAAVEETGGVITGLDAALSGTALKIEISTTLPVFSEVWSYTE